MDTALVHASQLILDVKFHGTSSDIALGLTRLTLLRQHAECWKAMSSPRCQGWKAVEGLLIALKFYSMPCEICKGLSSVHEHEQLAVSAHTAKQWADRRWTQGCGRLDEAERAYLVRLLQPKLGYRLDVGGLGLPRRTCKIYTCKAR